MNVQKLLINQKGITKNYLKKSSKDKRERLGGHLERSENKYMYLDGTGVV